MTTTINIKSLAEAIAYSEISGTESIMMHKSTGEFALVPSARVAAREAQGWAECVSPETLDALGISGETSDDGMEEAGKIIAWMQQQA